MIMVVISPHPLAPLHLDPQPSCWLPPPDRVHCLACIQIMIQISTALKHEQYANCVVSTILLPPPAQTHHSPHRRIHITATSSQHQYLCAHQHNPAPLPFRLIKHHLACTPFGLRKSMHIQCSHTRHGTKKCTLDISYLQLQLLAVSPPLL